MADFNEIIYKGLLEGNEVIIQKFFNGKFKAVLEKIIDRVFKGVPFESAKAQLFNDLYVYLTENDAKRLRKYETEGNGNIVVSLSDMAIKFYRNERNKRRKMQQRHHTSSLTDDADFRVVCTDNPMEGDDFRGLVERILSRMKNPNQVVIIRNYILGDDFDIKSLAEELDISEGSVYTLKGRGLELFKKLYFELKDE